MRKRLTTLTLTVALAAISGCQADRETFENTDATLAPPPEVEAAPAYPTPPQGVARDVPNPDPDTLRPDSLPR